MNTRFAKVVRLALMLCLASMLLIACQPVRAEPVQPQVGDESVVIDGAGPISATDPAQIQAEEEFRAAAIAKEEAWYAGDPELYLSFFADDIVSVQPGMAEIVGKDALAEGLTPYMEGNKVIGNLTLKEFWVSGDYATRYAEWEEVITPNDGGKPIHQIGRCFLGWERIDGEWKVVSEFINYLVPPTELE